jgi:hypothetical protein
MLTCTASFDYPLESRRSLKRNISRQGMGHSKGEV